MPDDLLMMEPEDKGKAKLYVGVDDEKVDGRSQKFSWAWIRRATRLKRKDSFESHLDKGHFGAWEKIGAAKYRLADGHRAVCRFNNNRHANQKTIVVTKDQYDDMMAGRPVRNAVVMIKGRPYTKTVTMKRYNKSEFIAVPRYSPDQAHALTIERVENDVAAKIVPWHDLGKRGDKFKKHFQARAQMFEDLMLSEMVLMARDMASAADLKRSADLPASILNLIDHKLSATQAEYYIGRFLAAMEMMPDMTKNPFMLFRIHQVILEEMQVEHYRDLQRLYGDNIDKSTQDALAAALARLHKIMPGGLMNTDLPGDVPQSPGNSGTASPNDDPYR